MFMTKYEPLYRFLVKQNFAKITLTLAEIEKILGFSLPSSAFQYVQWWSNSTTSAHPYSRAWTNAGFYTSDVHITLPAGKITFEKR